MRIGVNGMLWSKEPPTDLRSFVTELDELGYESFWTAEAYGADAFVPLAWCADRSPRMRFGTAVAQLSARTPAATAMAAMTMDHLLGGRFVLGLGVSGPQVVEGWHGKSFDRPLGRTREYVDILRRIFARSEPVSFSGNHYSLPRQNSSVGKPLKSALYPVRPDLPVYLGAQGPGNIALAREIADGWLGFVFSPKHDDWYRAQLDRGASGAYRKWEDFEVAITTWVIVDSSTEAAAERLRPTLALYLGGMGTRGRNFHADALARVGYADEVARVQELYLAGRKAEAAKAVPTALIEEVALVGPEEKIAEDLQAWQRSMVTTLLINGDAHAIRTLGRLNGGPG